MKRGEVAVIDAVSGAGKSTALGLISGALEPARMQKQCHEILKKPVDLTQPRAMCFAPDALGFVLQTNSLINYLSISENIDLPLAVQGCQADTQWRKHVISALGITELLDRMPNQISVGQKQRVSIARALAGQPAVLLLDEPVSALDPSNVTQVENLISVLAEEAGSAVLLASHQSHRGAFASARRVPHSVVQNDGITFSVFGDFTPVSVQGWRPL